MTNDLIVPGLMAVFTLAMLIGLAWLVFRLWAAAPMKMQQRLNREIAERTQIMAALAAAAADATPDQRERLAANYRFNRAAVLALNPNFDTSAGDAAFVRAPVAARRAA